MNKFHRIIKRSLFILIYIFLLIFGIYLQMVIHNWLKDIFQPQYNCLGLDCIHYILDSEHIFRMPNTESIHSMLQFLNTGIAVFPVLIFLFVESKFRSKNEP